MIEDLLPYYEKQLQEFSQQSRKFSEQYPKIAQRLSLNQEQIDDPHIERLIQAFSLIAARIDKKLADSYDVFTHSIFEVMFPQYLRHFPACSVISFDDINKQKQLKEASIIPKHTVLKSRSIKSVQCEFNTTQAVKLLPIGLDSVHFKTMSMANVSADQNATLTLKFDVYNNAAKALYEEKLPIYLDAISNFPLQVLDSIFKCDTAFSVKMGHQIIDIPNPFETVGFDEDSALLPIDQHTHHAYRLLMEYFCFSDKFNYLNLNLSFLKKISKPIEQFEIQIHFKVNLNDQAVIRNYSELSVANFKLFTTPIINLFEKYAEPQKLTHKQLEYPLITDTHHPEYYQVYSVLEMNLIREKTKETQSSTPVLPFFAMSHYKENQTKFFYTLHRKKLKSNYVEMNYSIISKHLEPYDTKSDFISTRILCSNRDLPHESLVGHSQNILSLNDGSLARRAVVLKRPTMPFEFKQYKNEQWRIISHLSLNTLALMKGDSVAHIKELLHLYNLSDEKGNHLVVDAIKDMTFSLTHKLVEQKPFPMFVRGVKAELVIDSAVFHGHSLYIFSQLISSVLNLKVQMNSFVDVIVKDYTSQQELYQCVQNVGGKTLL